MVTTELYYPDNMRNDILLTGAGFTASVGGYLAQEMWAKIFNHPSLSRFPNVKAAMRHRQFRFDYEDLYHRIVVERQQCLPLSEDRMIALESNAHTAVEMAMQNALKDLVDMTQDRRKYDGKLNVVQLKALIKSFAGDSNTHGFIFSTNQDLFMEALCWQGRDTNKHIVWHPGVHEYTYGADLDLPVNDEMLAVRASAATFAEHSLGYCKLHGSMHWLRNGSDNTVHVTGVNKLDAIRQEPLLHWYYEIFLRALKRPNVRLLVIGYGFKDRHINDVIRTAIKEYGLQVHIIDPRSPAHFYADLVHPKGDLSTVTNHQEIWDGIAMYLPYTLQQVFPGGTTATQETMINRSPAADLNRVFKFAQCLNEPQVRFPLAN